jgi:hypothetical protein
MPGSILMKLSVYIILPEIISLAYLLNPFASSTNTTASQIIEVIPLMVLECLTYLHEESYVCYAT